jgi:hypothetical protein
MVKGGLNMSNRIDNVLEHAFTAEILGGDILQVFKKRRDEYIENPTDDAHKSYKLIWSLRKTFTSYVKLNANRISLNALGKWRRELNTILAVDTVKEE